MWSVTVVGSAMLGKQARFHVLQTAASIQPSKELQRQEPEKKSDPSGCFYLTLLSGKVNNTGCYHGDIPTTDLSATFCHVSDNNSNFSL